MVAITSSPLQAHPFSWIWRVEKKKSWKKFSLYFLSHFLSIVAHTNFHISEKGKIGEEWSWKTTENLKGHLFLLCSICSFYSCYRKRHYSHTYYYVQGHNFRSKKQKETFTFCRGKEGKLCTRIAKQRFFFKQMTDILAKKTELSRYIYKEKKNPLQFKRIICDNKKVVWLQQQKLPKLNN